MLIANIGLDVNGELHIFIGLAQHDVDHMLSGGAVRALPKPDHQLDIPVRLTVFTEDDDATVRRQLEDVIDRINAGYVDVADLGENMTRH